MFLEDLPLLTYLSGLGQIFKNLHSVEVRGCGNLIYLVTSSMAKTLVQLKVLTIEECKSVEEIVRYEEGEEPYDIVFSKLQRLRLVNLQSLKWFCSTTCIFKFPSLEQFEVKGCPQMEVFCETVPSTPRVKKVEIDMDVEEHFLGYDVNTIIRNTALEKFKIVKVTFEKDHEALGATTQSLLKDYKGWGDGDSDDDDDEVNDDDDDDDEVNEEEDVERKTRMREREIKKRKREMKKWDIKRTKMERERNRTERMYWRMRTMTDHNQDD
ncbi:uncharacterized protein LOC117932033 [Vitis riparia]|uniref:uncharacterized protein LOC117932033 n=1 Tax=Vitis riparia TaxID=96939 RepID=UPI00155B01ED|nr:uncharacterized protein LOC117932033 [Vitis riparia]